MPYPTNRSISLLNINIIVKQNLYIFYTFRILQCNLLECYPEQSLVICFLFVIFVSSEKNTDWCGMIFWTA